MQKRTFLSILLCFSIVFSVAFVNTPKASAWWTAAPNIIPEGMTTVTEMATLGKDLAKMAYDKIIAGAVTAYKIAALLLVQQITQAIIGDGGGGVITDWNRYLFVSPQQRAMMQMNSFFNTVSRGRLSSLNYEGVGPNYDAYLVAQARMAIAGQPFTTNLQEFATDPTQLFAGGNMKGIMAYMQCANNVACYTLTSAARYNEEFARAQEIARNEQNNGFLPIKKNGHITQPASILFNALSQIDQLGTKLIMDADGKNGDASALAQIAAGAGINVAARAFNYFSASDQGKAIIASKNDEFPFSLGYSMNGGLGLSAGGVSVNTGLASINGSIQIGNNCVTGGASADAAGNTYTMINGVKTLCPKTGTTTTVAAPSATVTLPTIQ